MKDQQNTQLIKKGQVAAEALILRKQRFINALRESGGVVVTACRVAGIDRRSAYNYFERDEEFRIAWLDAKEDAADDLLKEALHRAKVGEPHYVIGKNGKRRISHREKSDTLLIFLMKTHSWQKKWLDRLVLAGNRALRAVRETGEAAGLTEDQIVQVQDGVLESFKGVPTI